MKQIMMYFLLFIIYSIIGWAVEMIVTSIDTKKIVNRGFLIGPYCPVYGIGAISIIIMLSKYKDDFVALFILAIVICSLIEYLTSYLMEKIFNARWWDYSHLSFNINGRICLGNSIIFGLGGLLIVKVNPFFERVLSYLPSNVFSFLFGVVFTLFLVDAITSFNIINRLKLTTLELRKDNTFEITDKVRKILNEKSLQFKRLLQAFPDMKINKKK
ncbi:MAG: putative ABC transporter permease [Bacilli bacterium]